MLLAFKMPKNYSASEVAELTGLSKEYEENKHLFQITNYFLYLFCF